MPWPLRRAAENALCRSAPARVEVDALQIGPVVLLSVPAEATSEAGATLEAASGATRLVSVANGYLGYVDTAPRVRAGEGEAARQYFGPGFLEALGAAANLAGEPLRYGVH